MTAEQISWPTRKDGRMSLTPELRKIRAARKRREKADEDLRSAILAARSAGATLEAIADASGLTRQRIWQIERGIR